MKDFFAILGKIFNYTRIAILNILFFGILIIFFAASAKDEAREVVTEDDTLLISLNGLVVEQTTFNNSVLDAVQDDKPQEILLFDLVKAIDAAAEDERVSRMVILPGGLMGASFASLDEIGQALDRFKASGKPILASAGYYSQGSYYLASFADEILVAPMGGVEISGIASFRPYFGEFLERFGIDVHVFKVGKYKSAVEPFIERGMSPAARENSETLIGNLWRSYVEVVERNRNLNSGSISAMLDHYPETLSAYNGNSADLAIGEGLADQAMSASNRLERVKEFAQDEDDAPGVSWRDYVAQIEGEALLNTPAERTIAVVVASGEIADGSQPRGVIGGDSTAELIKQAREDESVSAIVMRVNSPGGSATASERIREELLAAKEQGLPVVISMGGLAASGGYWISTSADYIFANPQTITGSIGVFGMVPTFERLAGEYNIYSDGVATTPMAGGFDPLNGLSEPTARTIQLGVEEVYDRFLTIVAEGRDSTTEAVHEIAQGRVWSGESALELGLVDEFGDLTSAVNKAAELAKIGEFEVNFVEKAPTPFEEFLSSFSQNSQIFSDAPSQTLDAIMMRSLERELVKLRNLNDPRHIYATCDRCDIVVN